RDDGRTQQQFQIDLFNVKRQEVPRVIPRLGSGERIILSPDANLLACAARYGYMQFWEPVSGQEVQSGMILGSDLAFSSNGRFAAASHWPQFTVWDMAAR